MAKKRTKALVPSRNLTRQMTVEALAAIPEEEVWLASRKSSRTRRAYQQDVHHFMQMFGITTPDDLRKIDHRAVMAWERHMREEEGRDQPSGTWSTTHLTARLRVSMLGVIST